MGGGKFAVRHFGSMVALLLSTASALAEVSCDEPQAGTRNVPLFSPPISEVVIGVARLQFFSAPNMRCPIKGVFIVPGDQVISYAQTAGGWSSVTYSNTKTGNTISGWERSSRLKAVGAVGQKQ